MSSIMEIYNSGSAMLASSGIGFEVLIFAIFTLSYLGWTQINAHLSRPKGKTMAVETETRTAPRRSSAQHLLTQRENIVQMLHNKEFTKALNKWRQIEREGLLAAFPGTEQFFETFLTHAIRVGKQDVCERLFEQLKQVQLAEPLSLTFWQMVLKMLASRRQYSTLLAVWKSWGAELPNDKVVFSCLINAALESGAPEVAREMLPKYRASETPLLPREYNTFFRTYAALADADASVELYRELETQGVVVETLLFNILLLTCVKAEQADRAFELVKGSIQKQRKTVDVVSFNTVLKGFASAGNAAKCLDVLDVMTKAGLQHDDVTHTTVLDACLADSDMESALEMVRSRSDLRSGASPGVLVKGFLRANRMDKALQIFEESGCPALDRASAAQLVRGLTQGKQVQRAIDLVAQMMKNGARVDDVIMTNLLDGCWQTGALDEGEKIFANLVNAGVVPSEYTLIAMLKLYARAHKLEESLELLETWKSRFGKAPTVIHYTCFMAGACRAKQVGAAWKCYQLMVAGKVTCDDHTVRTLLPALQAAQLWAEAVQLATDGILAASANTRSELLNELLDSLLRHGLVAPEGHHVFELMARYQVPCKVRNVRRRLGLPDAGGKQWQ